MRPPRRAPRLAKADHPFGLSAFYFGWNGAPLSLALALMPRLANQPWFVSPAHNAPVWPSSASSTIGFMSARFTMLPSSATKAPPSAAAGVLHPEALRGGLLKIKQHAPCGISRGTSGRSGVSCGDAATCASMRCMPAGQLHRCRFILWALPCAQALVRCGQGGHMPPDGNGRHVFNGQGNQDSMVFIWGRKKARKTMASILRAFAQSHGGISDPPILRGQTHIWIES